MKKTLILVSLSGLLLASCKSSQLAYNADDAYASPAEEKKKAELAKAEAAKQEEAERQRREEAAAAQKAKDDANPYYKDPSYNADDYYDYEYAARLNRFHNPIGVGYYDAYYTNLYTYNQNPSMYGMSIYNNYGYGNYGYNSYWCGMPSTTFNNWSWGISSGWGYGNGYYNSGWPSMYYSNYNSPWYNDPWNSYGYYGSPYYSQMYWGYGSPYGNTYMNGYYAGYYNGLYNANYYNMYDPNSGYQQMSYGPRNSAISSNTGHNRLTMDPSGDNSRSTYMESVRQQQVNAPRFSPDYESSSRRGGSGSGYGNASSGAPQQQSIYRNRVEQNRAESTQPSTGQTTRTERVRNPNAAREYQEQNNNNANRQNRSTWENNSGGGGTFNSGGSSSPRNGAGDGGAHRRSR